MNHPAIADFQNYREFQVARSSFKMRRAIHQNPPGAQNAEVFQPGFHIGLDATWTDDRDTSLSSFSPLAPLIARSAHLSCRQDRTYPSDTFLVGSKRQYSFTRKRLISAVVTPEKQKCQDLIRLPRCVNHLWHTAKVGVAADNQAYADVILLDQG
jgi:hypothetical protein